jgi:hypothetical protein
MARRAITIAEYLVINLRTAKALDSTNAASPRQRGDRMKSMKRRDFMSGLTAVIAASSHARGQPSNARRKMPITRPGYTSAKF